jgi:hypothetical protein
VFGKYLCQVGVLPQLVPSFTGNFANIINEFVYGGTTNAGAAAPLQGASPAGTGHRQSGRCPHLEQLPPGSR